jgi:WD40 repeat protein
MVIMAFAEFMNDKDAYSKYYSLAHELSLNFVSNTLKTVWDLLNKELPGQISHADIRNLNSLRLKIRKTLELRKQDGKIPKFKIRKLHFKFALLNDMFTMMDIFIFPNFVEAHSDGVKGLQYSTFDNYLWLSGGHDCILKIHDIRLSNHHLCLAQYVGHKSIITDVHFNKEESQILSSSFDRTVKLWSSQNSTCERTFIGHTDAVLSCDFSPDGRYVASGSMDNTIKIWDLSTGECVSTAKKHTRWVKVVRYSGDGKHLVSASLDRRILIWDSKLLVNSKTPTPIKTIDVHLDYVLDIAIKENKILTTSRDNSIRMFDLITGYELNSYDLSPSWACTVSFSDNGDYFATGSFDNNLVIFKTSDFSKVRQIRVFNFGIMAIRFPGDLSYVAVGTSEGFIQQIPL